MQRSSQVIVSEIDIRGGVAEKSVHHLHTTALGGQVEGTHSLVVLQQQHNLTITTQPQWKYNILNILEI